ncbi:cobalamin biosynthesis protein [Agrobacterium sp. SHOUNA12C]|nr:cobalamin biosynthesis protein [Rhizobium rhizogenes]KAA6489895.1 precorrin methylase [Agrobacterium sp. ICMP 7243]MCJ9723722.1 cobalamin biosynthesis protein [Agrobacterium sp. BETTINA12B]MCJ9759181.1 cobalamin biosynthesis protein [Agrobacterium sp. SHOUNA12C]OCJ05829.1 precorrin methylase [Agrobacterium sp. 13-626]OCJ25964.1 precorrin methylase [Agrobacterium sp. B131/95]OCJ30938.1 precorrin methylase [Agrobacterium sp. B133/95]
MTTYSNSTRRFLLGLGCERGTDWNDVRLLAERAMQEAGIGADQLLAVVSIDTRMNEPAMLEVATHFRLPLRCFNVAALERETPRLKNPSDLVFAHVGCHGVAEAAALAAAGPDAELVVPKIKSAFATAAIAKIG